MPSFSTARAKTSRFPSGDQRGVVSRMPDVSRRPSAGARRAEPVDGPDAVPPAAGTAKTDVSYRLSFSFTVTRTNATVAPSGEICGSAIHVNLNKSFSVMKRFPCAPGNAIARRTATVRMETFFMARYYQ